MDQRGSMKFCKYKPGCFCFACTTTSSSWSRPTLVVTRETYKHQLKLILIAMNYVCKGGQNCMYRARVCTPAPICMYMHVKKDIATQR
jgi:hypothetical protein